MRLWPQVFVLILIVLLLTFGRPAAYERSEEEPEVSKEKDVPAVEAILEFAGKHQVMVEVNASPYRLDLDWRWLRRARELGVLISLNPDAHSLGDLDDVAYGVIAARKGWLEPENVLNTYPPEEVALLLKRRQKG